MMVNVDLVDLVDVGVNESESRGHIEPDVIDLVDTDSSSDVISLNDRVWTVNDFTRTESKEENELRRYMGRCISENTVFNDIEEIDAVITFEDTTNVLLIDPPKNLCCTLYPHQVKGMSWLYAHELENHGGLLADDQGLGKTVQIIALILKNNPKDYYLMKSSEKGEYKTKHFRDLPCRTLIIVPLVTLSQWKNEINKFSNFSLNSIIYHGNGKVKKFSRDTDIVISTYHTVSGEVLRSVEESDRCSPIVAEKWFRVVMDESHAVKNAKTQLFQNLGKISAMFRWCLTGTPIFNDLMELYTQLSICKLKKLPSRNDFRKNIHVPMRRISKRISRMRDPSKKALEIRRMSHSRIFQGLRDLVNTHVLRRTKETRTARGDPLIPLPQKRIYFRQVTFTVREAEQYKALETGAQGRLKIVMSLIKRNIHLPSASVVHFLLILMRLRQFCDHPMIVAAALTTQEDFLDTLMAYLPLEHIDVLRDNLPENLMVAIEKRLQNSHVNDITSGKRKRLDDEYEPVDKNVKLPVLLLRSLENLLDRNDELLIELKAKEAEGSLELVDIPFWCSSKMVAVIDDLVQIRDNHRGPCYEIYPDMIGRWKSMRPDGEYETKDFVPVDVEYSQSPMKVLVFTQFVSFMNILEIALQAIGFRTARLDGSMSQENRQIEIEEFSNNPEIEVFLISLKAGGVGLNLVAASHVFLLDMWWNACLEDQAIDRVHRITQQKQVKVFRYCIAESVEMKMLHMQEEKKALSKGTFSEQFEAAKVLSWKEIAKLIGVEYGSGSKQTKNDLEEELSGWDYVEIDVTQQIIDCANGSIKCASIINMLENETLTDVLLQKSLEKNIQAEDVVLSSEDLQRNFLLYKKLLHTLYKKKGYEAQMFSLNSKNSQFVSICGSPASPTQERMAELLEATNSNIKSFRIANVYDLKESFFCKVVRRFPYLVDLSLGCNGAMVNNQVLTCIQQCLGKTLEKLCLRCCYGITCLDPVFQMERLRVLDVSECSEADLDVDDFAVLSWNSRTSLEYLDMSFCIALGKGLIREPSRVVQTVLKQYAYLHTLRLAGLPAELITLNVLSELPKLTFLKAVQLSECSSVLRNLKFLEELSAKNKFLRAIDISGLVSEQGEAEALAKLSESLAPISLFARLSNLNLAMNVCIRDAALVDICSHCLNLKYLNVSKCVSISSEGFSNAIPHLCNIEVLVVSWCKNFNNEVVSAVFLGEEPSTFRFLIKIYMFGCEVSWPIVKQVKRVLKENSRVICSMFL